MKIVAAIFMFAATSAGASTVALDESWGADRSRRDDGGYAVKAWATDESLSDGSSIVGRFSFYNATITGSGHSRSFTGSLWDHATEIAFTIDISTTLNSPGLIADWWRVSADLPDGYSWGGADGWVAEQRIGQRWIIRDPVAWVEPEQPAPVPLPATGGLLGAILGLLMFWRRPKPTLPDDNGWSEERHERDRMAGDTIDRLRERGL